VTARPWLAAALVPATLLTMVIATPAAAAVSTLADFEGSDDPPTTFYVYNGGGAGAGFDVVTIEAGADRSRPDQAGPNNILSVGVNVPTGWAGFGENLSSVQDWSDFDGLQFWMHGTNSGAVLQSELLEDNAGAEGERFDVVLTDNWTGWRLVQLPFAGYQAATDYQPAPGNGVLDLDKIRGYIFPVVSGTTTWAFDDLALYSGGAVTPSVGFSVPTASVTEGGTLPLTVRLNVASESTVTVDVASADDGATAGADYTAVSSTLTFAPGETTKTVDLATAQDAEVEGNETLTLTLSAPSGATLGTTTVRVTVRDDDAAPASEVWDNVRLVEGFDHGGTLPARGDAPTDPGFETFTDPNAQSLIDEVAPPVAIPGGAADDTVVRARLTAPSYAGFTHKLSDESGTVWTPQDWSRFDGISFWLYGQNTGTSLFVDILDNRNPDSTTDDAGRYSTTFTDDTLGWRYVELPFSAFTRKDVGNGAPNDGLTLSAMHGWAFGITAAATERTFYLEDVSLTVPETVLDEFEYAELPSGTDPNGVGIGFTAYGGNGGGSYASLTAAAPADTRPGAEDGTQVLQLDANVPGGAWAGVSRGFDADGEWVTQDWSGFQGVNFWFQGDGSGENLYFDIVENRAPGSTRDDAERWSASLTDDVVGWRFVELEWADFSRKEIGNGAPNDGLTLDEVHGWAFGPASTDGAEVYFLDRIALWGDSLDDVPLLVGFDRGTYSVTEGDATTVRVTLSRPSDQPVSVDYATTESADRTQTEDGAAVAGRDYTAVTGTLTFAPGETLATFAVQTTEDAKHELAESVQVLLSEATGADISGFARSASISIADDDAEDPRLVEDFEGPLGLWRTDNATLEGVRVLGGSDDAYPGQAADEGVGELTVTGAGAELRRDFAEPQDWSAEEGLTFWYRGTGSGEPVTVALRDDSAPDPGPDGWTEVVYRDDFDGAAGTPVDPTSWSNETGGWGWGNAEHQYYTPGSQNVWQDGEGNLEIELRPNTDESLWCSTNGAPCGYTSARIATQGKQEFLYGRIEARLKVPSGEGLWPAFWTLGNDFHEVGWPQTGEIDIMEHVEGDNGRPWESFGTVHGPGYSGGQSVGRKVCLDDAGAATTCPRTSGVAFSDEFHTYGVEWEPDRITWLLDGEPFGSVTPADLSGEWVFDHPFFLIANMAIGGNFGGTIDPELQLPASYLIDYIQVEQAPDTAERFEATFVDDSDGWQQVTIPFDAFERSADQPAGAPDNGLTLSSVHGLALQLDASVTSGAVMVDALRIGDVPDAPTFSDVAAGHPFYEEITWLAEQGVTTGFPDGTFRGLAPIERQAMAAFLYRYAGEPAFTPPAVSPFDDVRPSDPFYKEITWLAAEGVTTGFADGTFRPAAPIERQAMAAFLYRFAAEPEFTPPAVSPFDDVRPSDPFYKEITWLAAEGVTTGFPDGTFRSRAAIERQAMAAFLFRFAQL